MWGLRQVLTAARLQMRVGPLAPVALLFTIATPLVLGLLVTASQVKLSAPTLIGTGFAGLTFVMVGQVLGMTMQERMWGTGVSLNLVGALPQEILGRVVGSLMQGVAGAVCTVVLLLALHHQGTLGGAVPVLAGALLGVAGFYVISVLLAVIFLRVRFRPGMANGVAPVIILLAGLFSPLSQLPGPVRWLSWAIPPAWAMNALRAAAANQSPWPSVVRGLLVLAAFSAVVAALLSRLPRQLARRPDALAA